MYKNGRTLLVGMNYIRVYFASVTMNIQGYSGGKISILRGDIGHREIKEFI
jgi:hypothetical protein